MDLLTSLRKTPLLGPLVRAYESRFTSRGRALLGTLAVFAVVGIDTRRTQVYVLFAAAAGLFVMAALFAFRGRPRVQLACRLPARATARTPVRFTARIANDAGRALPDLLLSVPPPDEGGERVDLRPRDVALSVAAKDQTEVAFEMEVSRRGRYVLRGPRLESTDPFRFMRTTGVVLPDQVLLVYPRFYSMEQFSLPLGRRYQPGGIPLSSNTGDAIEFIGTRDYREGDPVRNIHWRSWARRGKPVVKEYQEEYFCRIALILDTFLPRKPSPGDLGTFEAAISVLASIADYFSRSEYIVDILAAGPDVYEVSAGRSLAYLENILDVLACLEPCHDPPFETIGPHLFERLAQLTTVVAVLQDWDPAREAFLARVKELGTAVQAVIVHDGPTRKAWQGATEAVGDVSQLSSRDVERLLTTSASAPGPRAVAMHDGVGGRSEAGDARG